MADGFYTNDDDDRGSFGGYGSDGADTTESDGDFGNRPVADRAAGAGGYRFERFRGLWASSFRGGCDGDFGRAA